MKPAERVTADWLLERGFAPSEVRRQLAVMRPLYLKLRTRRREIAHQSRLAERQMNEARRLHVDEWHSQECWARLAWGDGECECDGATHGFPDDDGGSDRRCSECGAETDYPLAICDDCAPF